MQLYLTEDKPDGCLYRYTAKSIHASGYPDLDGGVLEVVIDKPKANAIDIKVSQALGAAFTRLRDDPELSVGIITGAGDRIFCAGWDLKALNSGEMQMDNWWELNILVNILRFWSKVNIKASGAHGLPKIS